ncbi:MAG: hypothetical protein M3O70_12090 [Actinomycetota bacterium]|nr:hypothetical protein [Actinomycetota bacterium]
MGLRDPPRGPHVEVADADLGQALAALLRRGPVRVASVGQNVAPVQQFPEDVDVVIDRCALRDVHEHETGTIEGSDEIIKAGDRVQSVVVGGSPCLPRRVPSDRIVTALRRPGPQAATHPAQPDDPKAHDAALSPPQARSWSLPRQHGNR